MSALASDLFLVETARRVDGDVTLEARFCRAADVARTFDDSVLAAYVHAQAASLTDAAASFRHVWVPTAIAHWSREHDELSSFHQGLEACLRQVNDPRSEITTWIELSSAATEALSRATLLRSLYEKDASLCLLNRHAMDAAAALLPDLVSLSAATHGGIESFWTDIRSVLRAEQDTLLTLVPADYPASPVRTVLAEPLDPDEGLLTDPDDTAAIAEAETLRRESLAKAREQRDELLRTVPMYSPVEVERLVRGEATDSNPSQFAARLRKERRLLGVKHAGRFSHPVFQFDPATRQPRAEMRALLALLPATEDGWTAMLWCYRPNGKLAGQRPADVFGADATAVIDAARREFAKDRAGE